MNYKRLMFLTSGLLMICLISVPISFAANQILTVDLASGTGAIKYGASGFLYGMGSEGVPTDNMLIPLKPYTTAQKAPDGLQHPNGDALKIAPQFKRCGGKYVQIYMQDVYAQWPYENLGINDYLAKVDTMVRKVVADPNRSMYVYVPLNEPDQIWYSGNVSAMCNDWRLLYNKIRSIDSTAKIAGPNFASYNNTAYNQFMTYCKNNNCLPDIITWHELQNSFFTNWYNNVNNYRAIETSLGISARPISINEYARSSGDLGVPGNLVQWMARLENSKVEGSLAYWTTAGTLNDLVTQNNKATGGWWLYKWYGELTGNTVTVAPPTQNGSLQGLAALDSGKKQARVLLGGSVNSTDVFNTDVVIKGFGSASYFGSSVRVTVWGIDNTGTNPSDGPYFKQEGDYTVSNGQITVTINSMKALSAYQMIITPNKDLSSANTSRYEAEYASISGSAVITYDSNTGYSGTYFVEGYGSSSNASTTFVVTAANNAFYNVKLRYSAGGAPSARSIRIALNGSTLTDLSCPATADWNTWADASLNVLLTAGINRIAFNAYTTDDSDSMNLDYIEITPVAGTINSYEAEASGNTLNGTVVATNDSAASGGKYVGYIGNGSANTLQFNNVNVGTTGTYRMVVQFANAEKVGDHAYNNNIVDRYADISVNGGAANGYYFFNTLAWNTYRTTVIDVNLNSGNNTIKFSNSSAYAPNIDKIDIAACYFTGTAPSPTPTPGAKLNGTPFGTTPAWASGREYDKAWDGNTSTYFDYANASSGYTGLDLSSGKVIKRIRFYPRSSYASRMNGGKFQGSNTSTSSGFIDLYTIPATPSTSWNEVNISNTTAYRYIRYLGPNNSYCNVAEIELYE